MEITRQLQPGYSTPTDSASATNAPAKVESTKLDANILDTSAASNATAEPRLEQLQDAMRQLPDVNMEKVLAIRQALARGELSIDSSTLAKLMASHHRGSEA
ncbi:MAG: flagellar biosynthesis anti-sigma factor FlgM [Cellvibrio sp.]|uniref:flagellar biosynthesis anti-sigma factor FlgM n=1 Tax=Cellvibrio sp. TaxID=1965322 RepID=UPI0031A4924A